ncbi:MAG: hypothetical protein HC915_19900 [Anaerolineae bacterium]|nr:hypothetical protein [Anaerolineae bacterium]
MVLLGVVAWGGELALTSLTVQALKPSYQTVWALLDGNYTTGSLPGGVARLDPEAEAVRTAGNQAVVPGALRLIPFAALGGWLFWRRGAQDAHAEAAFLGLTVILFMLWSPGWSPQWSVLLAPLILLNFPTRGGVLVALVLISLALVEYPLLFRLGAGEDNVMDGAYRLPLAGLILARTALLVGLAGALYPRWQGTRP